jgi:hypothetical protein
VSWGGLIGVLVLFAAVALVFTARYPRGIFAFVLGLDRWVARVAAYAGLMTDAYPPFRLDQGGEESDGPALVAPPAASLAEPAPTEQRGRAGAGRIALFVVGSVAALLAFALLAGGCALVAVDQTQRDEDGFLMSPSRDFATSTYAIVSDSADIDLDGPDWAAKGVLGTVRIRSESDRPVFVGIAPDTDAAAYLGDFEHVVVTRIDDEPHYSERPGGAPASPPGDETFWVASVAGTGEQTLDWEPEDGSWSVVVMNTDATRGVASELSIGAELDPAIWVGIGLLVAGGLLAAGAALAITAGARRRGR